MDNLPEELIYIILYKLEYKDIVRVLSLSRKYILYDNIEFWKYKISLLDPKFEVNKPLSTLKYHCK